MSNQSKYKNMSDDALDNLFRDAHAQEGTENLFSDSFWNEMEAMLPPVENKKRRPVFFWLTAASILLLGSVFGLYKFKGASDPQKNLANLAVNPHLNLNATKGELQSDLISNSETHEVEGGAPDQLLHTAQKTAIQNQFNKKDKQLKNTKNVKVESTHPNSHDYMAHQIIPENKVQENVDPKIIPVSNGDELTELTKKSIYDPEKVVSYITKPKQSRTLGYLELGMTLGQAPYVNSNGSRDLVAGCVFGGGIQVSSGKTFFQGGLQFRMEGFKGLTYVESNFTENIQRFVQVKQLYSVEFPLAFGYTSFKHQVGLSLTPGIQCFMGGNERIVQNNTEVRNERITGPVSHSNSATLEMGVLYYYQFNSRWSAGAKVNMDLLRPFHTDYYLGKTQMFPINGQLTIRRSLFW